MFHRLKDSFDIFDFFKMLVIATFSLIGSFIVLVVATGIIGILILPGIVSEETFTDVAIVESVDYVPSTTSTSFAMSGKAMIPITNTTPAKYITTFNYKGEYLKVNNQSIYNECKNFSNKKVTCKLKLTTYDNNKTNLEIESVIKYK